MVLYARVYWHISNLSFHQSTVIKPLLPTIWGLYIIKNIVYLFNCIIYTLQLQLIFLHLQKLSANIQIITEQEFCSVSRFMERQFLYAVLLSTNHFPKLHPLTMEQRSKKI